MEERWLLQDFTAMRAGAGGEPPPADAIVAAELGPFPETPRLSFPVNAVPADADPNALLLRLYFPQEVTRFQSFNIFVDTDRPSTPERDCWYFQLRCWGHGWREVTIPLREMGPAGDPRPQSIRFINIALHDQETPVGFTVLIGGVWFVRAELDYVVSDRQFIETAFRDDLPAASQARDALRRGDEPGAVAALVAYFRGRSDVKYPLDHRDRPQPSAATDAIGERFLRHEFDFTGKSGQLPADIDWGARNFASIEWWRELNWHRHWVAMGRAYWDTGDERYAEEFVAQLYDWIKEATPPNTVTSYENVRWRDLEVASRVVNWYEAYQYFLGSAAFDDAAQFALIKNLWLHGDQLLRFYIPGYNHSSAQTRSLLYLSILYPEFAAAPEWREVALHRMCREMETLFYPDGVQKELSTSYQVWGFRPFEEQFALAGLNGVALPDEAEIYHHKIFEYFLRTVQPSPQLTLPNINDGDRMSCRGQLEYAARVFGEPEYRFVLDGFSTGSGGRAPQWTSTVLPWAGQIVLRENWAPGCRYLFFDIGPAGISGHRHEDMLNIVLCFDGFEFLTDHGRYTYADDPTYREYFVGSRSHNVVLVDGQGQNRRARPETYEAGAPLDATGCFFTSDALDWAMGRYEHGYGPKNEIDVKHRRQLLYARESGYFVVSDALSAKGRHRYELLYQLYPVDATLSVETGVARTLRPSGANLLIVPIGSGVESARIARGEGPPAIQGWHSESYNAKEPSPTVIYEKSADGETHFDTLLLPLPAGAAGAAVEAADVSLARLEATTPQGERLPPSDTTAFRVRCPPLGIDDLVCLVHGAPGPRVVEGREVSGRALLVRYGAGNAELSSRLLPWPAAQP